MNDSLVLHYNSVVVKLNMFLGQNYLFLSFQVYFIITCFHFTEVDHIYSVGT